MSGLGAYAGCNPSHRGNDAFDFLACGLLGQSQFIKLLQVQPHFGGSAQPLTQP